VRHDDGLETVYGHNAQNLVKTGDRVEAQTVLAKVGSTGRSTGPHLHFEVRRNGTAIDPIPFLAPGPNEALAKAY
jgi:murein DD-endopeptidase MepM/ murein hydrolase activator NlpD